MRKNISVPIPKKLTKKGELVVITKKEYERLLAGQDEDSDALTPAEKRAVKQAEKNFREGKYITLDELKKRLDTARKR